MNQLSFHLDEDLMILFEQLPQRHTVTPETLLLIQVQRQLDQLQRAGVGESGMVDDGIELVARPKPTDPATPGLRQAVDTIREPNRLVLDEMRRQDPDTPTSLEEDPQPAEDPDSPAPTVAPRPKPKPAPVRTVPRPVVRQQ